MHGARKQSTLDVSDRTDGETPDVIDVHGLACLVINRSFSRRCRGSGVSNKDIDFVRTQILANIKKELEVRMSGEELQECHSMINYVQEMLSGRDSSWGAFCTVKTGSIAKIFMVCDDWLVGKFALEPSDRSEPVRSAKFVQEKCPPGG